MTKHSSHRPPLVNIKRIMKDWCLVAFGQFGAMAALFVQGLFIARELGPAKYGHWVLIVATFNFLAAFLSFRTSDALTAFWVDPRYESSSARRSLFSSAFYAELLTRAVASIAGVVACVLWLKAPTSIPHSVWLLAVYACAMTKIIGIATPIWISLVRASKRMRLFVVVPAIQAWLSVALVAIFFHVFGANILSVAISLLVAEAAALVARLLTMPYPPNDSDVSPSGLSSPPSMYASRREHRAFWHMMGAGYISSCLSSIIKETDVLVVGWLGTPVLAGFYRLAKSLVTTLQTGVATISTVIIQDFADSLRRSRIDEVRALVFKIAPAILLLTAVASVIAATCIGKFLTVSVGPEYAGARTPFLYLLPGIAVATAFFWVQPLAVALQSSGTILRVSVLNFVVYAGTLAASATFIGPWAAALALSVAWGFGHFALLVATWPKLNRGRAPHVQA
jgi:O-antigen/teichoic acid export membrane protein